LKFWIPGVLALCLAATATAASQTTPIFSMNGRIPLGVETFRVRPKGGSFYLIASAEDSSFTGLYRAKSNNGRDALFNAGKHEVKFYPKRVQFRVTASSREKMVEDYPYDMHGKLNLDDLFKQLRFRIKVFRGLDYRYIQPSFVEHVGVPDNVRYNERIYRIGFNLGRIPITDRIVIEVLSPNGERLCKFHLDLL
jgi:hypothetical protein